MAIRRDGTTTQFSNVSYSRAVALQKVDIWWVEDVINADVEDLIAADGIGEKTAKSMKKEAEKEFGSH
ncbi:helix-hairpin-helix domain-containing protein [Haloarchaeobius sp. TZWSO28]|uniref:helix-hairpin-helix domain-containing protein n=1 Tax=Haloarchaeobius sp. TZWSO28 TaxID=3446119 RepID=UPI003EBCA95E